MHFTRRSWLKRAAAAGVCGCGAFPLPDLQSADAPRRIPLGYSLYGMMSLSAAEALSACAKIGYDGVELALLPESPTSPKRLTADTRHDLRLRLTDTGLALVGLMENLSEPADETVHRSNLDRIKVAAELGQFLSPQAPPIVETVLGGQPAQWDRIKERLAERLRSWAEVGAATKTVIAVKPHVAHALHTPEGAKWLLEKVASPWIKLAFDYSHFLLQQMPLAGTVSALAPQSSFIHVKDARGTATKFEFLEPGEGDLDYADYFRRVQEAGYRGAAVVEISRQISSRPGFDPHAAAQRSYAKLAPAMRKAGVRP